MMVCSLYHFGWGSSLWSMSGHSLTLNQAFFFTIWGKTQFKQNSVFDQNSAIFSRNSDQNLPKTQFFGNPKHEDFLSSSNCKVKLEYHKLPRLPKEKFSSLRTKYFSKYICMVYSQTAWNFYGAEIFKTHFRSLKLSSDWPKLSSNFSQNSVFRKSCACNCIKKVAKKRAWVSVKYNWLL